MAKIVTQMEVNNRIELVIKLGWRESLDKNEYEVFQRKILKGFILPLLSGKRVLTYSVDGVEPLESVLKNGIDKKTFFHIIAQFVEIMKKVRMHGLNEKKLLLSPNKVFIHKESKDIFVVYVPAADSEKYTADILAFVASVVRATKITSLDGSSVLDEFIDFMNPQNSFPIQGLEQYILKNCPEVYALIRREQYDGDGEEESPTEDSAKQASNENEEYLSASASAEQERMRNDASSEDDIEIIPFEPEEEKTVCLDAFNQTQNQDVLQGYLLRIKTDEKVNIYNEVFRIGKSAEQNEYTISENKAISKFHASIVRHEDSFFLIDNHSTNGSYVDDIQLDENEGRELYNGARVRLADEEFIFYIE